MKLTPKQKKFAEYYIKCGNATEAAKKAGYSEKSAYAIGQENLKKPVISQYIAKRMEKQDKALIADADEVLKFFTDTMRGNIKDQFRLDPALSDRIKAAELLGKRYRLFSDKVSIEGPVPVVISGGEDLED